MSPADVRFWDAVDRIREAEPRYRRECYGFVMAALGWTVETLPPERLADPLQRHLSGSELLQGVVALARREFGLMAPTVFREWGLTRGSDLGAVVFQLVAAGQLSARPEDRLEDFDGGPELFAALSDGLDLGVPTRPKRRPPGDPGDPGAGA